MLCTEDDFVTIWLSCLHLSTAETTHIPPYTVLCGAGDWTQWFVHSRKTFFQLSWILCPQLISRILVLQMWSEIWFWIEISTFTRNEHAWGDHVDTEMTLERLRTYCHWSCGPDTSGEDSRVFTQRQWHGLSLLGFGWWAGRGNAGDSIRSKVTLAGEDAKGKRTTSVQINYQKF